MFIHSLLINNHISEKLGLKQFELSDLGRLVVLTGENGCGKTRLLAAVDWLLVQTNRVGYDQIAKTQDYEKERWNEQEHVWRDSLTYDHLINLYHIDPIQGLELSFKQGENPQLSLTRYVELSIFLATPTQKEDSFHTRLTFGLPRQDSDPYDNTLVMSPLLYVEDICVRYEKERSSFMVATGHPFHPEINDRYMDLVNLLRDLGSLILELPENGTPILNGVPLTEVRLSDGQALLLRWTVLIHSNVLRDNGVPILFEEPELHLHPKALNALFDVLLDRLPDSQLWVATHSLPLVAHLSVTHPRSLWFGKEGEFTKAGRNPPLIIEGLIGGKGGADELTDFCDNVSYFAMNSFATECLLAPTTVDYKKNDPQIAQIWSLVNNGFTLPIRILDFGAGQGRLLDGLAAECAERGDKLTDVVSYYAIEPEEKNRVLCEKCVEIHYGQGVRRVFESPSLASQGMECPVNFIVLANVLHEILPKDWLNKVFTSEITNALLGEDGWFLIVEDNILPRGEMAHHCGYVVLEAEALRELVMATAATAPQNNFFSITSPKYGARLQATIIARHLISKVSSDSIRKALEVQKARALTSIRTLRASEHEPTYGDGRRHSYLSQLVTNIILAIEEIEPTNATS